MQITHLQWPCLLAVALAGCNIGRTETDATFTLVLTAGNASAVADGQTTIPLSVQATSSLDMPVQGLVTVLEITDGQGNLRQPGPTDASGAAQGHVVSNVVGDVTIRIMSVQSRSETVPSEALDQTLAVVTVSFVPVPTDPDAPNAAFSTFRVVPNALTVGGTTSITLTVQNFQGNPLAGYPVSITSTGSQNVGLPASGNTNGSGVFTATLASIYAEMKTVTATAGGVVLNANVYFVAGLAASVTLAASPNSIVANGTSVSHLTATVFDAYGNPVSGQTVTLSGGPSDGGLPVSGSTNGAGQFVMNAFATTQTGTYVITAQSNSLQGNTTVVATP